MDLKGQSNVKIESLSVGLILKKRKKRRGIVVGKKMKKYKIKTK